MTTEAVKDFLEHIKLRFIPAGTLDLVSLIGNKIELSITGLPEDMFKIQGKLVNSADESKRQIAAAVEKNFPGSNVTFI